MAATHLEQGEHLAFKNLALEPRLARRLPAEVARRFHALPLAEDRGRITVAMADPNDPVAREAVTAALGPSACVVRCDADAIDSLLAQIWGCEAWPSLRLLACVRSGPLPHPLAHYAEALSCLLTAQLDWLTLEQAPPDLGSEAAAGEYDLYIVPDTAHSLLRHLLSSAGRMGRGERPSVLQPAVLMVREPRWPVARVLLLLCGHERDQATVDWVLHLAHKAHSQVTVLAVVPPLPAMYGQRPGIGDGLPGLLTANSPLGQQMRQVARNLVAWEIEATLRLREGPPAVQIRRELATGHYDLIAVASRPCSTVQRWLHGDEVRDILRWTNCPVLVTAPAN